MNIPLDGIALAQLVAEKKASPIELVDDSLSRINRVNGDLNAVIHHLDTSARERATAMTKTEAPESATLWGVPFLTKDLTCMTAGDPYHAGNIALRDANYHADHDSYLAIMFRDLGLVNLGRTNTPEFGGTITTEPVAYGASHNPWNLKHSTGGSSGGSAAAVAAGIVPIAHANDGGGSIRIPASECGLFGLKPSRGRVSFGPLFGELWGGATMDGVVSRSVRDSARVLDGISRSWPGDPYSAPKPKISFEDSLAGNPQGLRIGICPQSDWGAVHSECTQSVESAAKLLEGLGHKVEIAFPKDLFNDQFFKHFRVVLAVANAVTANDLGNAIGRPLTKSNMEADTAALVSIGQSLSGMEYLNSIEWFHSYTRQMVSWWNEYDVLITPVLTEPPPLIGELRHPRTGSQRIGELLHYTAQFNVTGQPAMSMPLHETHDGLPVGVQFIGPPHGEDLLLALATQIETASPWAHRLPSIWSQ
jgi:amidase